MINARLCPANIRESLITLFIMLFLITCRSRDRSRTDIYHLTYNVATKYTTRDLNDYFLLAICSRSILPMSVRVSSFSRISFAISGVTSSFFTETQPGLLPSSSANEAAHTLSKTISRSFIRPSL